MAPSSTLRFLRIKSYLNLANSGIDGCFLFNKIPVRYLRGSRYGKDHNQEELKFQRLLRTFKLESKSIDSEASSAGDVSTGLPEKTAESSSLCVTDKDTPIMITPEDLIKKLEEKFSPLKDLPYKYQLEKKYKKSLGILRIIGRKLELLNVPIAMGQDKLPCPVDFVVPSPVLDAYRNRDDFNIGLGIDGNEKTVGFFLDPPTEFSTPFCISPEGLSIVRDNHKKFVEDFQNFIRLSPLPASQHFTDRGYWKNLMVRSNGSGDVMGIVVMHPQDLSQNELQAEKDKLKDYFSCISKSNYNLHSLYFQTCMHSRCTHEQSPFELIYGDPFIIEEMSNMTLHISPDSFFHLNTKVAESMLKSLLKLCRVNKSTTVLDISCGVGPVSFLFSPRVKRCIGIDDSMQAIIDAKLNAMENRSQNVDFIYGRPESVIRDVLGNDYHEDLLVVLNSSRCIINKPVITALREFKNVDKIVYVCTKPQAAVDNIIQLCRPMKNSGKAFLPILAVPVDLCPHTDQFGLVMMLQRL